MTSVLTGYGHSWVDGDGASDAAHSLIQLAGAGLGLRVNNRAVGGSLSTAAATLVQTEPPEASSVFLLMTGLNDARLFGDVPSGLDNYASALETIFAAFEHSAGSARVVALEQPFLADYSLHAPHNQGSSGAIAAYNSILRSVGSRFPRVAVLPVPGWNAASMLDADTVHPNDAGHAHLAGLVVAGLKSLPA